jgi:hypothetical protein
VAAARAAVLEITPVMNSACEEIFAFKTCCGLRVVDQNLELRLRNVSDRDVVVQSRCELIGPWGVRRIDNLLPPGERRLAPGELAAFYCEMDEAAWRVATEIAFYEVNGGRHARAIGG